MTSSTVAECGLLALVLITAPAMFLFAFDDFFVDAVAIWHGLKPHLIGHGEFAEIKRKRQRRIAILIANWREDEVLGPMVRGNIQNLDYGPYTFFLGVYPNDESTWSVARRLESSFPGRVVTIVNSLHGPTSKGQMLNEMVRAIRASEAGGAERPFDFYLLQDSEDVLHPQSLSILNDYADRADFVQLPVLSFSVPKRMLVGGLYIDEFSESHTKDLLVRDFLGAAIPSAGVGTMVSSKLVDAFCRRIGGLLREDTLTEDYDLGITAKRLGFRCKFACVRLTGAGRDEFVATREYFPSSFGASVRQKSRWILGIAFQGLKNLGWSGTWVDRYFLMRDRRGPLNSLLIVMSALLMAALLAFHLTLHRDPWFFSERWFQVLVGINLSAALWRLGQKARAVRLTHSTAQSLMVFPRWFVGAFVNATASWRALRQFRRSVRTGRAPVWFKTQHRLPERFGQDDTAGAGIS